MLKYISAQPATEYYSWQVATYLYNFKSLGIKEHDIIVLFGCDDKIPQSIINLINKYIDVTFVFYKNSIKDVTSEYPPAIQAYLMSKFFNDNPHLEKFPFFFHDADFCFTQKMDFTPYLNDDKWYFSDTISYIGYDYIKTKNDIVFKTMCDTMSIDPSIVIQNNHKSGGAQKLMKNLTKEYWSEVLDGQVRLFRNLKKVMHADEHPIQVWTASMWAELWVAWKNNVDVEVIKEFDFCWATDSVGRWDSVSFFHNAGVIDSTSGMFHKSSYINKSPFETDLILDNTRCSFKYYELIKKTGVDLLSL